MVDQPVLRLVGSCAWSLGIRSEMDTGSVFLRNFLKWQPGRQQSGYEKMLLLANSFVLPFDCYLLRYKKGSGVPAHTDPVDNRRHFRLNIVLRRAQAGGEFHCSNAIYNGSRIKLFRPDRSSHSVTSVEEGVRYVLSVGWVLK